jgi:hypothetical protein
MVSVSPDTTRSCFELLVDVPIPYFLLDQCCVLLVNQFSWEENQIDLLLL